MPETKVLKSARDRIRVLPQAATLKLSPEDSQLRLEKRETHSQLNAFRGDTRNRGEAEKGLANTTTSPDRSVLKFNMTNTAERKLLDPSELGTKE